MKMSIGWVAIHKKYKKPFGPKQAGNGSTYQSRPKAIAMVKRAGYTTEEVLRLYDIEEAFVEFQQTTA